MTVGASEAGPPVICPVTGRTWPRVKMLDLKRCRRCTGYIDIRHEAWLDGPEHVNCHEAAVADA